LNVELMCSFCSVLPVAMSDNVRMATFSIAYEEDEQAILPPPHLSEKAHCSSFSNYLEMYSQSVKDPEAFWTSFANELTFFKKWEKGCFLDYNFDRRKGPVYVRWMPNASLNVCYNCLDRNISRQLGDKVAFYWEGNEPGVSMKLTYRELLKLVCKFANVLKRKGVKKGDRVIIYMPMILELPIAMLACARIGAVHSTVFGGYSAQALAQRIVDAKAEVVITADGSYRGKKPILLKQITDQAISICEKRNVIVKHRIIVRHLADNYTGFPSTQQDCKSKLVELNEFYYINQVQNCWFDEEMSAADENCESEWMDSEDPLFILYTSGSTGVPKGLVHTQAGYLLYVYTTFRYVFDYQDDDVYFCTADIGWITGHSYVVYGPLANGSTVVMFEGVPYYPEPSRYWDVVDKYGVSKFYTAPTAIRHLMKFGSSYVERCRLDRLEVLGSVGEPINPEVWQWYYKVVGKSRCAIVDTYWQTETGGHVLTPLPGCTNMKPGSASFPFFGVKPVLLNHDGQEIVGPGEGQLAFSAPWPGIARSLYGNHDRYMDTYFSVPGYFSTGDGCTRDEDGYYWITGRIDDMMNVSGHLLSSAEIENAVVSHPAVAEAAVVCAPDPVKGQIPYCFVTLKKDYAFTAELVLDIKQTVRNQIGPVATPEVFQQAESLPKTRSGKILRRVLRDVAGGNTTSFGDLSTLSEEHVIADLVNSRSSGIR
ncbi:Acetyl-coenzyme A synthetase, partial [Trichinella nativa]